MKKILLLILPLFLFLFLARPSFAQNTTGNPLFNFFTPGTPKNFFTITDSKKEQKFLLLPFTNIVIQENTFSENNINLSVFEGNFDNIKTNILSKGYSPIASYYFVFKNTQGKDLIPGKPIKILTYNNYLKSTTFYYPINKNGKIDTQEQISQPGPVLFKADLPVNDPAFVIAVNKDLDKNDSIFNDKIKPIPTVNPTGQSRENIFTNILILKIMALVLGIIIFLVTLGFVLNSRRDKSKKIKKVEEPPKIIIGGK